MAVGQLSTVIQRLRCLFNQGATEATDESLLESFLKQRDEAAFEALVRRHGPMVLGVCRRILGNVHDAEDAFQATFLVLVRKAASIRPRSMVGNWLYGVACRTALDARRAAAKRKAKEAAVLPCTQPSDQDRADLRAVLDEELQRLPPKSRAVIVLSDLEGKTRTEVALQLGWPEGSVASRLARARARLAKRLARYGLAVSGGPIGTLLPEGAASASVPPSLLVSTVKAASLLAAGQAAAGAIPAPVAALAEGALKAMLLNKVLKTTFLVVLVLFGIGTGMVLSHATGGDTQERTATPARQVPFEAKADAPGAPAGRHGTDEAKTDLDRVQGTWRVVSSQVGDEKAAEDEVKRRKVTVKGNVLTYDYGTGDRNQVGTVKLDPKTKYLDWNITSPEAGTTLALYEIKGDEWKIGFGNDGVFRPRSWAIGKDDVVWLLVLKREQPSRVGRKEADAGQETPLQKEWKRLEGTWKPVAYESDGEKVEGEAFQKSEIAGRVLTIEEGKYRLTSKDGPPYEAKLTINPTAKPKRMELTVTLDGKTQVGRSIYELDGDTLRICTNFENAQVPPKGFTAKGSYVMVYKRKKGLPNAKSLNHSNEAVAALIHGDYDKAIAEATEAIRLDSENVMAYLNRGSAYVLKGEPDKAIKDFDRVIQLEPKEVRGYDNRAAAYAAKGDYRKAVEDYREAMQVGPGRYEPHAYLADLLATCPDRDLRDGKKAIELATKACELTKWNDCDSLSALAAASAEVADFKKAVEWQKKAMKANGTLAYKTKQQEEESRQRLKSYEEGKPYRRQAAGSTEKGAASGDDRKALQGTWVAVAGENSKEKFDKELKGIRLVFQGDKLTLRLGDDVLHAAYKLDPDRKPKAIDLTLTEGRAKGETILGIFALEGGKLKLCLPESGQERPTEFAAEGKPGLRTLLVFRHEAGDLKRER